MFWNSSKGESGLFSSTEGTYNRAGSKSVKKVDKIIILKDEHNIPLTGEPNSVTKNYKDGKLVSERYYDEEGNAYLDIDYTDHGNARTHSIVPHEHDIWFDDYGNVHRGKEKEI